MKPKTLDQSGFTLVEVLVSLAISALLMAALAAAFNASATSYRENRDSYNALNSGRQALCRMTAELRTGYDVDPDQPSTECTFKTSDGTQITYQYDSGAKTLYLIKDSTNYTLCENVNSLTFTRTPTADNNDCTSVEIQMQVQGGDVKQDLAAAAVMRRNL